MALRCSTGVYKIYCGLILYGINILINLSGIAPRKVGCNCLVKSLGYFSSSDLQLRYTILISRKLPFFWYIVHSNRTIVGHNRGSQIADKNHGTISAQILSLGGAVRYLSQMDSEDQYFYCYQLISCSEDPNASKKSCLVELWGGCTWTISGPWPIYVPQNIVYAT